MTEPAPKPVYATVLTRERWTRGLDQAQKDVYADAFSRALARIQGSEAATGNIAANAGAAELMRREFRAGWANLRKLLAEHGVQALGPEQLQLAGRIDGTLTGIARTRGERIADLPIGDILHRARQIARDRLTRARRRFTLTGVEVVHRSGPRVPRRTGGGEPG